MYGVAHLCSEASRRGQTVLIYDLEIDHSSYTRGDFKIGHVECLPYKLYKAAAVQHSQKASADLKFPVESTFLSMDLLEKDDDSSADACLLSSTGRWL
jgi:hypothetical protein